VLGRFGGDEFTILLRNSNAERASAITERLLNAFQAPLVWAADTCRYRLRSASQSTLRMAWISNADQAPDTAMYEAKRQGGGTFSVYVEAQGARCISA